MWGTLFCLVGLTGARFELHRQQVSSPASAAAPPTADVGPTPQTAPPAAEAATAGGLAPSLVEPHRVVADTIGADDSIYQALKRHGVSEQQIAHLNTALAEEFDPRTQSRAGDFFSLQLDSAETVLHFAYTPVHTPERPIHVERHDGELRARKEVIPLETRTSRIVVTIQDNLSNAVSAAGEGDVLTDLLADEIFGSVIDFHRDPRQGDQLNLVITKLHKDGEFVRYGKVLLARYEGQVVSQVAVYHRTSDGRDGYFDETGASIERLFMLQPLSYRRISGRFARSRFHPVLKRNRPHLGTDYAAAAGTEVWATARGRVSQAGWSGGFGKLVEVEHPNGYRTRYAHLSRILVRPGQTVAKRDLIGRVGATGLATGPHLHYELLRNGHHLDPMAVNREARGTPLAAADRGRFVARRDELMDILRRAGREDQVVVSAAATTP